MEVSAHPLGARCAWDGRDAGVDLGHVQPNRAWAANLLERSQPSPNRVTIRLVRRWPLAGGLAREHGVPSASSPGEPVALGHAMPSLLTARPYRQNRSNSPRRARLMNERQVYKLRRGIAAVFHADEGNLSGDLLLRPGRRAGGGLQLGERRRLLKCRLSPPSRTTNSKRFESGASRPRVPSSH